jgi:hypothetical protein
MNFTIDSPSTHHLGDRLFPEAKIRPIYTIVFSWPGQRHFPERTAQPGADMPGDHIDTRFQRLRYLRHDRFARSILLHPPGRTGTEYVRTFSYFVSPFSSLLLPFLSIASGSPNPNSIYIRLLQGFVPAVNVKDVVGVGRLIAASVFGRRESSLFSDWSERRREPCDLSSFFISCLE